MNYVSCVVNLWYFYLLELTLKTKVSNTMNTVGRPISSNAGWLVSVLKTITICYCCCWAAVQSALHQHARRLADDYATDSLPHRWCDPSRVTPLSVAPVHQVVDVMSIHITHVLIGNVGDGNFRNTFFIKKAISQQWTGNCREISHKHCK